MDLLYSRYASPMDFMKLYIDQGRFGEFVTEILEMDYKRREKEAEKEDDRKFWDMYIRILPKKSFREWKKEVLSDNDNSEQQPETLEMSEEQVESVKEHARGILKNFSPY